jgi:hypothetical protein
VEESVAPRGVLGEEAAHVPERHSRSRPHRCLATSVHVSAS